MMELLNPKEEKNEDFIKPIYNEYKVIENIKKKSELS